MAKSATAAPAQLEVMRGWVGTKEVPGPKANPTIAGKPWSWFSVVGYPEIKSDEVANCAAAVGASIVFGELIKLGIDPKTLTADGPSALDLIAQHGAPLALPPHDDRLLARSYCKFGVDARNDPQPGDIMVIPRGAAWQGHVVLLNEDLGGGVWECIGANQSDTTSPARHRLSEALAIRRYVPATVKDLRVAGSTEIKTGDTLQNVGVATAAAPTVAVATAKALEAATQAPVLDIPTPDPAALEVVHTTATKAVDGLTLFTAVGDAAATAGRLFVSNPWIVICMAVGIVAIILGHELKKRRVAKAKAGVPLSAQIATA